MAEQDYQQHHLFKAELEIKERETLLEILKNGRYATLALCRDNEPYILTLSYGYDAEQHRLHFHTAVKGLKLDFIKANPRVCATVIEDTGYQHDRCSHGYRSLVMRGFLSIDQTLEEKKHGMEIMLHHLEENPDPIRARTLKNDQAYDRVIMMTMKIETITGKAGS